MRRLAWLALAALWIPLLNPAPAAACSCVGGIPICESFWKSPVVFAGQAIEIAATGSQPFSDRRVRFKVERAWRGDVSGTVDVMTGGGGGDCGYDFRRGERYLVYTYDRGGALWTSICSRTKRLSAAAEDLAYLNQSFGPSAGGRIFGQITHQASQSGGTSKPAANYVVTLRNASLEWRATTDAEGRYEMTGIPAGTYEIAVVVPPTEHAYGNPKVELADARGCAAVDFTVVPNGRVAVRVVDSDGRPLPRLSVQVVRLSSLRERFPSSHRAQTNADGEAQFAQLPPDRYVLGINITDPPEPGRPYARVFYPGTTDPGEATAIDVGRGERVQLEPFRLRQPLRNRTLVGQVVWPDGRSAAGASVYVNVTNGRQVGGAVTTDADGRFELTLHEGVTYQLGAFINAPGAERVQWSVRSADIAVQGALDPVRLVLEPPRR